MSRIYSLRDADDILPEIAVVVQRLQHLREEVIALRDAYRGHEGVGDSRGREASRRRDAGIDSRGGREAGHDARMGRETGFDAHPGRETGFDARAARELIRLRLRGVVDQMQADVAWLDERDIVLRDIAIGLLDFPGEADGEPIWLCWRMGEDSVAWWHGQDEGFAGRRRIDA